MTLALVLGSRRDTYGKGQSYSWWVVRVALVGTGTHVLVASCMDICVWGDTCGDICGNRKDTCGNFVYKYYLLT